MQFPKELNEEVSLVKTLGSIVQAYEEIYVLKIQKVRDSVIKTRSFMVDLSEIFKDLREIYLYQQAKNSSKKNLSDSFLIQKSKNSVAVLLSASRAFSREINQKVMSLFLDFVNQNPCDLVVVGKIGKELYDQRGGKKVYQFYDLPEEITDENLIKPIIDNLIQYEKVNVFYGKFINLIEQIQSQSNITGEVQIEPNQKIKSEENRLSVSIIENKVRPSSKDGAGKTDYLFEPSLEEILAFFEKQIFTSLFKQSLNESYLAQIGSRIKSLNESSDNIQKHLEYLAFAERKLNKTLEGKKQRQRLAGISLWQTN